MRKVGLAICSAALFCLATAVPALAGSGSAEHRPHGPKVLGNVVHVSGTAFTGTNIVPWLIALGVLLVFGATMLALGRRRSAA